MTGGHFTRTYELWRNTMVQNPVTGEITLSWAKVDDIPGRAYPASVTDTIAAAHPIGVIVWTFACSPDAGVKPGDQIRFDGRILEIKAVPVTSRGDRCECRCKEVQ